MFALLMLFLCVIWHTMWFQRLPPARGGTAQKKIIHLANWSQLIHPGPASSLTKVFLVSSKSCVNADSLLIRAAATSTSGTLNDLTTGLIMANNNNNMWSSKSPQLPCILPFGILCFTRMMFVKILLAVCILVGIVV